MNISFGICVVLVTLLTLGTSLPPYAPQNHGHYPEQVRFYPQQPRHRNSNVFRTPSGIHIPGLPADRIENVQTIPADVESFTIDGATIVNSPPGHGHPSVRKIFIPRPGGGEPIEYDLPAGDASNITVIHLKGQKGRRKNGQPKGNVNRVPQGTNVQSELIAQTGATSSAYGNYAPRPVNYHQRPRNRVVHRPTDHPSQPKHESHKGQDKSYNINRGPPTVAESVIAELVENDSAKVASNGGDQAFAMAAASRDDSDALSTVPSKHSTHIPGYISHPVHPASETDDDNIPNSNDKATAIAYAGSDATTSNDDNDQPAFVHNIAKHEKNPTKYTHITHRPHHNRAIAFEFASNGGTIDFDDNNKPVPHKYYPDSQTHTFKKPSNPDDDNNQEAFDHNSPAKHTKYTHISNTTPSYPNHGDLPQNEPGSTPNDTESPEPVLNESVSSKTTPNSYETTSNSYETPSSLYKTTTNLYETPTNIYDKPVPHKYYPNSQTHTFKKPSNPDDDNNQVAFDHYSPAKHTKYTHISNTTPSYPNHDDLPQNEPGSTPNDTESPEPVLNESVSSKTTPNSYETTTNLYETPTNIYEITTNLYETTTNLYETTTTPDSFTLYDESQPDSSKHSSVKPKQIRNPYKNKHASLRWTPTLKPKPTPPGHHKPLLNRSGHDIKDSPTNVRKHVPDDSPFARTTTLTFSYTDSTSTSGTENTTPGYPSNSHGNDLLQKEKEKTADYSKYPTTTHKAKDSYDEINHTTTHPTAAPPTRAPDFLTTLINLFRPTNTPQNHKRPDSSDMLTTKPMISTTEKYGSERSTTVNTVDNNKDNENNTPGYPSSTDGNILPQKEKENTADDSESPTTTLKSKDSYDEINDTTTHSTVAPPTRAPDFLTTLINLFRPRKTPRNYKRPDSSDMLTTKPMISTTEKYGSERSTTVNYTVDNNTDNEITTPGYPSSSNGNDLLQKEKEKATDDSESPNTTLKSKDSYDEINDTTTHPTVAPTTRAPDFLTTKPMISTTTKPMISTTEKYRSERSTTVDYKVDDNTDNEITTPGYPSSSDGNDLLQKEKEKTANDSESPTTTFKSKDSYDEINDTTTPSTVAPTTRAPDFLTTLINLFRPTNTPQNHKRPDSSDMLTTKPMISTTEKYESERSTTVDYTVDNNTDNQDKTTSTPNKEQNDTVKKVVDTTTDKMIKDIIRDESTTNYESKIKEDSKTINKHEKTKTVTKHEETKTVVENGTKPKNEKTLTKDKHGTKPIIKDKSPGKKDSKRVTKGEKTSKKGKNPDFKDKIIDNKDKKSVSKDKHGTKPDTKDEKFDHKEIKPDTKDDIIDHKDKKSATKDKDGTKPDNKDENPGNKDKNHDTKDEIIDNNDKKHVTKDEKNYHKEIKHDTKDDIIDHKDKKSETKDKDGTKPDNKDENPGNKDKNHDTKDEIIDNNDKKHVTKDEKTVTKDEKTVIKDEDVMKSVTKHEISVTKKEETFIKDEKTLINNKELVTKDEKTVTKDKDVNNKKIEHEKTVVTQETPESNDNPANAVSAAQDAAKNTAQNPNNPANPHQGQGLGFFGLMFRFIASAANQLSAKRVK